MLWRPSCVWDCVWHARKISWAWYPWAWLRSWGTWARRVASSSTGRPACHQECGPFADGSTWCCTTTCVGRWCAEPSGNKAIRKNSWYQDAHDDLDSCQISISCLGFVNIKGYFMQLQQYTAYLCNLIVLFNRVSSAFKFFKNSP